MRGAIIGFLTAFVVFPVVLAMADPVWVSRDQQGNVTGVFMQPQGFEVEPADTTDPDVSAFLDRKPDVVTVQEQLDALWETVDPKEGTKAATIKAKVLAEKQDREAEPGPK